LRQLKTGGGNPSKLRDLFGLERARWDVDRLARNVLKKEYRVYYLDYVDHKVDSARSYDISALDPDSAELGERTWGHLLSLSSRVNAAVADVQTSTTK
jgi:hypothetical protein